VQPLIFGLLVIHVALPADAQGRQQKRHRCPDGLVEVLPPDVFGHLEQLHRGGIFAHQQIPEMAAQTHHEQVSVETFAQDFV